MCATAVVISATEYHWLVFEINSLEGNDGSVIIDDNCEEVKRIDMDYSFGNGPWKIRMDHVPLDLRHQNSSDAKRPSILHDVYRSYLMAPSRLRPTIWLIGRLQVWVPS